MFEFNVFNKLMMMMIFSRAIAGCEGVRVEYRVQTLQRDQMSYVQQAALHS